MYDTHAYCLGIFFIYNIWLEIDKITRYAPDFNLRILLNRVD